MTAMMTTLPFVDDEIESRFTKTRTVVSLFGQCVLERYLNQKSSVTYFLKKNIHWFFDFFRKRTLVVFTMPFTQVALYVATVAALVCLACGFDINDLSLEDLASQMNTYDIGFLINADGSQRLNVSAVTTLLEARQIGSLFNSPSSTQGYVPTVDEWRTMQQELYELSSTLGNKIPLLYGLDSVHGANYVYNATLFPQQIGVAATFNTTVAFESGRITGLETRYAGIPWVYSPILGIAVQPSWARVFETFGEDTVVVGNMGVELIRGLQSPPPPGMNLPANATATVAACMKHYIGYTNLRTGHDRTPVYLPMNTLLQYYAPPFQRAISEAGVLSVMENYIELNGRPVVASELLLKHLLRDVMGFTGMLVTDYNEIFNLADFHMAAGSYVDALQMSINATTIDMAMVGNYASFPLVADALLDLVGEDAIAAARVEESAQRVLALKGTLGLLAGSPVPQPAAGECFFACDSHRAAALDAAQQSMVLLQNDGILPMAAMPARVALVGQACDSVPLMAGGWTIHWQGTNNRSAYPYGLTLREELVQRFPASNITFHEACNVTEASTCDPAALAAAVSAAAAADVVFVCVGERHYAEKPGDIDDITLPGEQIPMVRQVQAVNPNIVLILVQGRPRILNELPQLSRAVVNAMLPGPFGGAALADVITGVVNPSGRQPITYPLTVNNAPIQYNRKYSANTGNDYAVQWPFGHGLSYTTFKYHSMRSALNMGNGMYETTISVSNTGTRDGSTAVLLFTTQTPRAITPEVQMLRNFVKVFVPAGTTVNTSISFSFQDLAYFDEFNCQILQKGMVTLMIEDQNTTALFPIDYSFSCSQWGMLWAKHTKYQGTPNGGPTNAPAPAKSATSEYVISSVVCFGAGIVGTVIIISYLRRRQATAATTPTAAMSGGKGEAGGLLEPTAV
jgi:beta-glucosidase